MKRLCPPNEPEPHDHGRLELWDRGNRLWRLCRLSGRGAAWWTAWLGADDCRGADWHMGTDRARLHGDAGAAPFRAREHRRRAACRRVVRISAVAERKSPCQRGCRGNAAHQLAGGHGRRAGGAGPPRAGLARTVMDGIRRLWTPRPLRRPCLDRFRSGAGGTAVPQSAGGCALEHEASLPGARRGVRFRPLPFRRCAAVQPHRRGRVERARPGSRARFPAGARFDDAQPQLDIRYRVIAALGISLDRAAW